jgi:F-type H+-transporting ATPase subunit gamma
MPNLRDIRKRRKGAQNTRKITRTMELVASAKLKKAQEAASASRPYAEGLREMIATISAASGATPKHPLLLQRPVTRVAILVATADRGLAGAFNANLVALAMSKAKEHQALGHTVSFIALGKKATSTLAYMGQPATKSYSGIVGATTFAKAERIALATIEDFTSGTYDQVELVYARFISPTRQVPDSYTLLPAGGITAKAPVAVIKADFEFEPDPEDVLTALIPQAVKTGLYSALLQTSAAEHAARRIAMKNASDAAGDMVKSLSSIYNRGRQGKITQEIAEIVGAVEAMA